MKKAVNKNLQQTNCYDVPYNKNLKQRVDLNLLLKAVNNVLCLYICHLSHD